MRTTLLRMMTERGQGGLAYTASQENTVDERLWNALIEWGVTPLEIVLEVQKAEPYLEIEGDELVWMKCINHLTIEQLEKLEELHDGRVDGERYLVPIRYKAVQHSILPFS